MVKFDVSLLRFLEDEDFRVLVALEMALRNHDVAPTVLIERIAGLAHGGARRRLNHLLKNKLIHHESRPYDGYSMKYAAYDYLALRTFSKRGSVLSAGSRIGCGKESDIILIQDENGAEAVLKLQRLGRCSFRSVSRNRDYKGGGRGRHGASWWYLSRLAAQKEFAFMKLLYDEGFPVPKPIDHNRHAIVMELITGATLLNNIEKMDLPDMIYRKCLSLVVRLAENGLIHGDFNEFNLFITDTHEVIMIDFPQMVSIDHPNADDLFDRDVNNLALFFHRRFGLKETLFPKLDSDVERQGNSLDRTLLASGAITKAQMKEMDALMEAEKDEEDEEEEEESDEVEEEEEEEEDEAPKAVSKAAAAAAAANNNKADKVLLQQLPVSRDFINLSQLARGEDFQLGVPSGAVGGGAVAQQPTKQIASVAAKAATAAEQQQQQQQQAKAPAAVAVAAEKPTPKEQQQQQQQKNDNDDDDSSSGANSNRSNSSSSESDIDKDRVAPSIATTIAPALLPQEEIKKRVKRQLMGRDDAEFRRSMHRNCMKGKEKRRAQRQIQNGMKDDAIGDW